MAKATQVNIHEAKTHLSRLVDEVAAGDHDVVIAKAGKPAALLTRLRPETATRRPGALKGLVEVADDFDAPLPEDLVNAFEGRP